MKDISPNIRPKNAALVQTMENLIPDRPYLIVQLQIYQKTKPEQIYTSGTPTPQIVPGRIDTHDTEGKIKLAPAWHLMPEDEEYYLERTATVLGIESIEIIHRSINNNVPLTFIYEYPGMWLRLPRPREVAQNLVDEARRMRDEKRT